MAEEEKGGSVNEIIAEAAYELAKRELNLKDDEQDKTKPIIPKEKLEANEKEVNKKIKSISRQIEISFKGAILPKGIDMKAAENVLIQITKYDLSSPSEINVGEEVAKECLIEALQNSDKELEDINSKGVHTKNNYIDEEIKSQIIKEDSKENKWKFPNTIVENPNGRYSAETIQAEQDIEGGKEKVAEFIKNGDMKSLETFIKNSDKGEGNDSTIRYVLEFLKRNDEKNPKDIEKCSNALQVVLENKDLYVQDIATFTYHIELLIHLNREAAKCTNPKEKEILSKMLSDIEQIDSRAVEYYKEHPELERLEHTGDLHDAVDREWKEGTDNKISSEFIKTFEEVIEESIRNQERNRENGNTQEIKSEDRDKPEQEENITTDEGKETTKTILVPANTVEYRKGIEMMLKNTLTAIPNAIRMLSSQATEDKKDVCQEVIVEKLLAEKDEPKLNSSEAIDSKKKLFGITINRSINKSEKLDSQLVKNLTAIDINAIKGVLKDSLIPAQNDKPSQILGQYVHAISDEIKSSLPIVLDSKKTQLSKLVGTPNALLGNSQKKRSQPEEEEAPELE